MNKIIKVGAMIALVVFASCKSDKEENRNVPEIKDPAPLETIEKECYQAVVENDTITLTVDVNSENQFEGELNYSYHEKDKSFGTIIGNATGDTIFADYKYESEGKTQVKELVFLRQDENTYIEGYGETVEVNNRVTFKDKNQVKFDSNMIYHRIECKE